MSERSPESSIFLQAMSHDGGSLVIRRPNGELWGQSVWPSPLQYDLIDETTLDRAILQGHLGNIGLSFKDYLQLEKYREAAAAAVFPEGYHIDTSVWDSADIKRMLEQADIMIGEGRMDVAKRLLVELGKAPVVGQESELGAAIDARLSQLDIQ